MFMFYPGQDYPQAVHSPGRNERLPPCSMGDAQVAQGGEKTGQRRAVSTRDELTERPSSSQSRPEEVAGVGHGFTSVVADFTVALPFGGVTYLWLLWPLFLHTRHIKRQLLHTHHHFCGGNRGLRPKPSSPRFPSTAPSWGWGTKLLTRPGSLDHTSLACHLLATCHLCTC